MKELTALLFCFMISFMFSQEYLEDEYEEASEAVEFVTEQNDRHTYEGKKNTVFYKKRYYNRELNQKYDFKYVEEKKEVKVDKKIEEEEDKISEENLLNFKDVVDFIANIFPYLLGVFVIFIIIKVIIGNDNEFWKFGKNKKLKKANLVYEEYEDINDTHFESYIKKAIKNKEYRLATRFFYLLSLQKLSEKELIKYHKDKTNTEYQFELQNKELQGKFSYISYIYNYVWYGEFEVNESKFTTIRKSFNNFIKSV